MTSLRVIFHMCLRVNRVSEGPRVIVNQYQPNNLVDVEFVVVVIMVIVEVGIVETTPRSQHLPEQ